MERIAAGYQLAEAPVATDDGGVIFSDVLGGGVRRWSPTSDELELVIPKRRGVGGMAPHAEGGLVVSGRDIIHVLDGRNRTLYAPGEESGILGFNDITVDPDGRVIVGQVRFRPFAGDKPVPGEFVAIAADGSTTTVTDGVEWVNGCAFSPDGATFYGCDYERGLVLAAERRADGTYAPSRVAATSPSGGADGMAVDETGALWVALGPSGSIGRFTPDGHLDDELDVPADFVSSLCFGGADGRDLFITTADMSRNPEPVGAVFLTRAPVAGAVLHPARI